MRHPPFTWLVAAALLAAGCSRPAVESRPAQQAPPAEATAISWRHDLDAALAQARGEGKPLMVDVFATWCSPCKRLDEEVFSRADVAHASRAFIPVKVDGDKHPDVLKKFAISGYPTILFLSLQGQEIHRVRGAAPHQIMLQEMAKAAEKAAATQAADAPGE